MAIYTLADLKQRQSLPLKAKILLAKDRINQYIDVFGTTGVYVAFSGGKDSTVLLDLVRNECGYKDVPACFVDTPTQLPELKEFVKTFDNVDIVAPRMSMMEVCEKYGFPLISKEVSCAIYEADHFKGKKIGDFRVRQLTGADRFGGKSRFNHSKWGFMLEAPFMVSDRCCKVNKKQPAHKYERATKRHPIMGTMAEESMLRRQAWMMTGCNSFNSNNPASKPLSTWLEQDVLEYIYDRQLPICSLYGEVIEDDYEQLSMFDDVRTRHFRTTGAKRTGCAVCGFGCHLEKNGESRFLELKKQHPKIYGLLDILKNNGYTMRQAIEWMTEHSEGKYHVDL